MLRKRIARAILFVILPGALLTILIGIIIGESPQETFQHTKVYLSVAAALILTAVIFFGMLDKKFEKLENDIERINDELNKELPDFQYIFRLENNANLRDRIDIEHPLYDEWEIIRKNVKDKINKINKDRIEIPLIDRLGHSDFIMKPLNDKDTFYIIARNGVYIAQYEIKYNVIVPNDIKLIKFFKSTLDENYI